MKKICRYKYINYLILVFILSVANISCDFLRKKPKNEKPEVRTVIGIEREFGEPFGIVLKDKDIYVSDGENNKILKIIEEKQKDNSTILKTEVFSEEVNTPSQIVFDQKGDLIIADTGSHTIKKVSKDGITEIIAGVENEIGNSDGKADEALFNAPVGVTVAGEKIYVADTYNDSIRVIENGEVTTLAGSEQGFADGEEAKFDTPLGLETWTDGRILVADAGNRRIRVIDDDGKVWTLAGNGNSNLIDGMLNEAELVQPTALAVDKYGAIYFADGNAIRVIGRRFIPIVETISNEKHGFSDGNTRQAQFNRPSGLAFDESENLLIADSDNQLVRAITRNNFGETISTENFYQTQISAEEFSEIGEPRWTYDPPENKRDIAGTMGEIRGKIAEDDDSIARFHNGLDIAGAYGETAYFIRDEKVLRPLAVQNFETTRELLRMPTIGYIHIRLGRDKEQEIFEDKRFQFRFDDEENPIDVRIPRGTEFEAGDKIGTLNKFNHVHLIAGMTGREMNALEALKLPNVSDEREPKIEDVTFYDEDWNEIEKEEKTLVLEGKIRIVVQAFDQMDGNAERRKLGLYKIGYQVLDEDGNPPEDFKEPRWNIIFDKTPDNDLVKYAYASGSQSGATGETIFRYIATNKVSGRDYAEEYFDADELKSGKYQLKVLVADFFGNETSEIIEFEIE